jgi:hypothetical protein
MTTLIKPQKFYEHGDEHEAMLGTFYCAACDIFMGASHLGGHPDDPIDVRRHLEAAARAAVRRQRMF